MGNKKSRTPKKRLLKQKSLMLHGLGLVTGDPTIKINYPFLFHPGVQISVTEPGEAKWVYLMLPLSMGDLITEVKIASFRSDMGSLISLIRLVEQRMPISATVLFDDKLDRENTSASVISTPCHVLVTKSIFLKLCMNFTSTEDIIEIGSIEVKYIPEYESIEYIEKKELKEEKQKMLAFELEDTPSEALRHKPSLSDIFFFNKLKKDKQVF
ncbi:hypothetical protein [Limibacterium fermenti]|uniref:hypothetical protein n=1 Tax=Limibacterium fermenti TaxID=3229863 RepID=UPI003A7A5C36